MLRKFLTTVISLLALLAASMCPCPVEAKSIDIPMTFVVVIDISGSMDDPFPAPVQPRLTDATKLEDVKRRLALLADHLPDNTRVLVTVFDHEKQRVCDLVLDSVDARADLRRNFESIRGRNGGTFLWRTADAELARAKEIVESNPEHRVRVLLYTDGDDSENAPGFDHHSVIAKYGDLLQSKVQLSWTTIGIDLKKGIKQQLEATGVSFTRADTPEDIDPLIADIRVPSASIQPGETLMLEDHSIGRAISERIVDWGDGTPYDRSGQLEHVYKAPGKYRIRFAIRDRAGRKDQVERQLVVSAPPVVPAKLRLSSRELRPGDLLVATDETPGDASTISWDSGAGQQGTGRSFQVRFAKPGSYQIRMTRVDSFGRTSTASEEVTVELPPIQEALLRVSTNTVQPDERVLVTDATAGEPAERIWRTEGDGVDHGPTFEVKFSAIGQHRVELTRIDEYGRQTHASVIIEVVPPPKPIAAFRLATVPRRPGDAVALLNTTDSASAEMAWSLDGEWFSSEMHPSVTLHDYEDHKLTLVATDAYGRSSTSERTIAIGRPPAPVAEFVIPDRVIPGETITLVGPAFSERIDSIQWLIDGETFSTIASDTLRLDQPGVYEIGLALEGPGGSDSVVRRLEVVPFPIPKAGFTVGADQPFVGDIVRITDTSSGSIESIVFEVVETRPETANTTSITTPIRHTFDAKDEQRYFDVVCERPGSVTIHQTVIGPGGKAQHSETISIATRIIQPVCEFELELQMVDGQSHATFLNRSSGTIQRFVLEPGDDLAPVEFAAGERIVFDFPPGEWRPRIVAYGPEAEDLVPSVWESKSFVIEEPMPRWVRNLAWQLPLGLLIVGLMAVAALRWRSHRLRELHRRLAGLLVVRPLNRPRDIQQIQFDGLHDEESVELGEETLLRLSSRDDGVIHYEAELVQNGQPSAIVELEDSQPVTVGDYTVTYTA